MVATVLDAGDMAENKTHEIPALWVVLLGWDKQFLNKEQMVTEVRRGDDRDGVAAAAAVCGGKDP